MKKSREIAYAAVLCALIAVLVMIGYVQIIPGVISVAVLPLVVVMLVPQMFGLKLGTVCSGFFGVMSLINSFIQPSYLADYIHNPLVSVFPRIIVGVVVSVVFAGTSKLCGRTKNRFLCEFLPSGLASALGVCTNTLLFLGMMWLLYGGSYVPSKGMTVAELIPGIIVANFFLELGVCTLLVPPLRYGVVRAMNRGSSDRSAKRTDGPAAGQQTHKSPAGGDLTPAKSSAGTEEDLRIKTSSGAYGARGPERKAEAFGSPSQEEADRSVRSGPKDNDDIGERP